MPTAITKAIFWGPSWGTYTGDKITGIDAWYSGHSNSHYAKTVDEYTGSNGQVGAATSHLGYILDTSTASGGSSTTTIQRGLQGNHIWRCIRQRLLRCI